VRTAVSHATRSHQGRSRFCNVLAVPSISMCSSQTTPHRLNEQQSGRVNHPCHPLNGYAFEPIRLFNSLGNLRVEFFDPNGQQISLPIGCTTLAEEDPYIHFSDGTGLSLQAAQAARLQPSVLAVPCAAVRRPAGCPPWAAQAASPGLRWSAARSLEPGVPAGTISHGRRPAACGLQSWSAAAAPAQQGVSLHLRRPEDAFPTVLWHKSV